MFAHRQCSFVLGSLLALLTSTLAGCDADSGAGGAGGHGGADSPSDGADADGMPSGSYLLTGAVGWERLGGAEVAITFRDGSFNLGAGCSSYSGPVALEDGVFVSGEFNVHTPSTCVDGAAEQDAWLAAFFESGPSLVHDEPRVVFSNDEATLTFVAVEVARADWPLVGTSWTIDVKREGANHTAGVGIHAPLAFAADDTFSVVGPCNTISGSFAESAEALTFSAVSATEAGCSEPSAADFEAHLLAVFADGEVTYSISESRLSILRGSVGVSASGEIF